MNYTKLALKNISSYGDTDIFPYPIANALFYDMSNEAITIAVSYTHLVRTCARCD